MFITSIFPYVSTQTWHYKLVIRYMDSGLLGLQEIRNLHHMPSHKIPMTLGMYDGKRETKGISLGKGCEIFDAELHGIIQALHVAWKVEDVTAHI